MRKAEAVLFVVWYAHMLIIVTSTTLIAGLSPKEKRDVLKPTSRTTMNAASLIAIFDMQGYRGSVEFHSNPAKDLFDETLVRVNLFGPSSDTAVDKLAWSIWERPADLTRDDDPCGTDKLGTELINLSEAYGHISTGNETFIRDTFALLDVTSLFERTLVLRSIRYGLKSCTLIRTTVPLSWTAEARFISPIGGAVVIRHLSGVATGVRASLLWTSGRGKKMGNARLHWSLVKIRQLNADGRRRHEDTLFRQRSCSHLWEMMASDQTLTLYTSTDASRVKVGGPSLHKDTHNVETNFTPTLPMKSEKSEDDFLTDTWVVLRWSSDEFVTCAPLLAVEARETIATFKGHPLISGYVHFYQASGYGDATVVTVNLTTTPGVTRAAGFGVDELTLWPAMSGVGQECLDLALSYFNPLKVDSQSSPLPSEGTTDRYAVGDLSGKMGSLMSMSARGSQFTATFYNQYVTLFGANGLIGRSVIVYEDNWYPLACSNLVNEQTHILAIAKFNQRVLDGEVILRQRLEGPLGADTSLLVHMRYKDEKSNSTSNHMWQIHSHGQLIVSSEHFGQRRRVKLRSPRPHSLRPEGDDDDLSSSSKPDGCGTEWTGVFNPYAVSERMYSCDCDKLTDVRCALGDLGNRLGPIATIRGGHKVNEDSVHQETDGGQLFVDTGLFLNGDFSVVGLTLVIYEPDYGNGILDCTTIELFDRK